MTAIDSFEPISHTSYFPGIDTLSQKPIGATEMYFSYDVKPRYWVSFDANYWYGGRASLNGVENPQSLLSSSRMGVTGSIPVTKHGSLKLSYSEGLYIRLGGELPNRLDRLAVFLAGQAELVSEACGRVTACGQAEPAPYDTAGEGLVFTDPRRPGNLRPAVLTADSRVLRRT